MAGAKGTAVSTMGKSDPIALQSIYEESADQKHMLGSRIHLGDGRVFHYAKNGAVALSAGKVCQGAIPVPNHLNRAVAAAVAIGDTRVSVTLGGTAATLNQYAEGYLHCNDVSPEGYIYKVKSHLAIALSTAGWFELYDPVAKVMTTSSEVTLTKNPWKDIIIYPLAALSSIPIGVPIIDVTAAYYCWVQTWGPCPVLTQGTVVIGQKAGIGGTADGTVGPIAADTTVQVGTVMQVNASTEYSLIFLTIAP